MTNKFYVTVVVDVFADTIEDAVVKAEFLKHKFGEIANDDEPSVELEMPIGTELKKIDMSSPIVDADEIERCDSLNEVEDLLEDKHKELLQAQFVRTYDKAREDKVVEALYRKAIKDIDDLDSEYVYKERIEDLSVTWFAGLDKHKGEVTINVFVEDDTNCYIDLYSSNSIEVVNSVAMRLTNMLKEQIKKAA